jgi:hypothetical protein
MEPIISFAPQGKTVKIAVLVLDPPGFVTVMGPVVAPAGTVATSDVVDFTVKVAGVPLKATAVAPMKCLPVTVTLVPTMPLVG